MEALLVVVIQTRHIERGIDHLGYGLDLCTQLLLDAVELVTILVRDQVDGDTQMAKTSGAADAMQISLCHAREVEVDHYIDGLHVYSAREQV